MGAIRIAAVVAMFSVVFSPVAHADPVGDYLNLMRNSPGVIGGPINEGIYVSQGQRACDLLRTGVPREDVISQLVVPIYVQPWLARAMVDAAQTALCPDVSR